MKRQSIYFIFVGSNLFLGTLYLLEYLYLCRCKDPNDAECPCFKRFPYLNLNRTAYKFSDLKHRREYMQSEILNRPHKNHQLDNLTTRNHNETKIDRTHSSELSAEVLKVFGVRETVKECNCHEIFNNNESEIKRAKTILQSAKYTPADYLRETKNCATFIRKRGYIFDSLTKTEQEFPIAFSILMFKGVEQSERLLRAIYRPQNIYCIHIDNKTDTSIHNAMESIASCFENVFISPNHYDVQWGKISVLEADLHCIEELWTRGKTWKYFINLTGQEFPLKTNFELVEILKAYNGANDMESTRKRAGNKRWLQAGDPPHGIIPTKGSVHVIASRAFVKFVVTDHRAKDLLEWCKKVRIPDEVFFSSLQHNPHLGIPGSYKGIPESSKAENNTEKPFLARFKNWGDGFFNWTCHGKRVRKICVIGVGDLPLLSTRKELFVNKLHAGFQPIAYDCLEELIFNRTRDYYMQMKTFDARWYKQLGFVRNRVY